MGIRIKYDQEPELVKPKLDDLDIETVALIDPRMLDIHSSFRPPSGMRERSQRDQQGKGYKWTNWSLNLSLSEIETVMDGVESVLEALDTVTQVLATVLRLLRVFTSDLKSFSRVLKIVIKLIVKQLREIIDGFTSTGIHIAYIGNDGFDTRDSKFQFPINGGYQEFVKKVNATCLNSRDPDAPKFSEGDTVGGLIFAMIGATNDPEFLEDMVHNFEILGRFFRFRFPVPAAPRNLRAIPGIYKDRQDNKRKKLGVKVSWEDPGTPITRFYLFRSPYKEGVAKKVKREGEFIEIRVFEEENFPIEVSVVPGRPRYTYIDFNVEENKTYFYKAFTALGRNFIDSTEKDAAYYRRIDAPNASQTVSALPRVCIPITELEKFTTLDKGGNYVDLVDLEGDWQSLSVRTLLGPALGRLFDYLDTFIDKLSGIAATSSDAVAGYIKVYQKKIRVYLNLVRKISDVIEQISEYTLRGNFMVLELFPEEGGIEGFVERFNNATMDTSNDQKGNEIANTGRSISELTEEGIMFGVMLVYGFPTMDSEYMERYVPEGDRAAFEGSFESTQKAIEGFMSLLGLGY